MADTFVQDPDEKYEFLTNPTADEENAIWLSCSQADYYRFGQVTPVRIIGPVEGSPVGWALLSEGGLPIPLDNMEQVFLPDDDVAARAWLHTIGSGDKDTWMMAWEHAVKTISAQLPERLKSSLFITK